MMKLLWVCAGLCLVFLFVWERVDIVRVGYQVERLKHDKVMLEREHDQLRVKVSSLSAPDRIARAASEKLGMVLPKPGQVIMVQSTSGGGAPSRDLPGEVRVAQNGWPSGRR